MNPMETIPADEAKRIHKAGTPIGIPARWPMIIQGTPPDGIYLILSGTVTIRKNGEDVATVGPGGLVGELSHEKKGLRSATVVADTALTTLRFEKETWAELKRTCPSLREGLAALAMARA